MRNDAFPEGSDISDINEVSITQTCRSTVFEYNQAITGAYWILLFESEPLPDVCIQYTAIFVTPSDYDSVVAFRDVARGGQRV